MVVYKWDWNNVYIVLPMLMSCTCLNPNILCIEFLWSKQHNCGLWIYLV